MISFKPTLNESLLRALNVRHQTITDNIANVDTPHYKAKSVLFEEELKRQLGQQAGGKLKLRQTHERHLPLQSTRSGSLVPYEIVESTDTTINNNSNNVDIDKEMAHLAENQLLYNFMIDRVNGRYNKMKTMLSDIR